MDRLDAMSILVAVAEAGSLSGAARETNAPLSTVSRKMSDLEKHLNAKLLVRSGRKLVLSEAGRSYVAACKRILDDLKEAERAASGEYTAPRGELVITAPIVFGRLFVLPTVVAFLDRYPEIDIKLVLTDRIAHLQDDHIDLALRIGALPESSLVGIKIGAIRRVVCGSPAYFAAHGPLKSPDALAQHSCIALEALTSPDGWLFRIGKSDRIVPIRPRLLLNSAEAAIDASIAGLGVTRVLSYQIARAHQDGLLEVALAEFEPTPWPVSLVYASQGRLPLKVRAFLDFAAPRLRKAMLRNGL